MTHESNNNFMRNFSSATNFSELRIKLLFDELVFATLSMVITWMGDRLVTRSAVAIWAI